MVCKAAFLLAAAAVAVVSLVAGKGRGSGPMPANSKLAARTTSQGSGEGGDPYTNATEGDAMTVDAALDIANRLDRSHIGGVLASPESEGAHLDGLGLGELEHPESEGDSTGVSFACKTETTDSGPKYKEDFSIDITGAEVIPCVSTEQQTISSRGPEHEKKSDFDAFDSEVISGTAAKCGGTSVPPFGSRRQNFFSSDVIGSEVIPSSKGKWTIPTLGPKDEKDNSADFVGAEIIPRTKGKRIIPTPGPKDEENNSTDFVGAEVIPRTKGKRTTPTPGPKDEENNSTDVVGAEVIPRTKGKRTTPTPGPKDEENNSTDVVGSEVIPTGASKSNVTTPVKTPKPSKVIQIKGAEPVKISSESESKTRRITPVKAPKPRSSQVTPFTPQRVATVTVPKVQQIRSAKVPRETKPSQGNVLKNKYGTTKSRRGPCKKGLGKDICSFQFHRTGRRHLITPEVLQKYLEAGWVPVTTPTRETMHVCCGGKTQMIGFVGKDSRKGDDEKVTKANAERIMNEEMGKVKRELGKLQKNNENK